ncbi:MAG: protein DA1 [Chloroflexales bacterium]|nr:protein DA1 [Chloroflexales bacterium]
MTIQAIHPSQLITAEQCASCGASLTSGYYTLLDRPERYCPNCIATRPRCDCCGAPLGSTHWRLHDGRNQCATCHNTAVYAPNVAQRVYDETVAEVIKQLGLTLNVGVAFRLVDAPTLQAFRTQGSELQPDDVRSTLGLYQRQGHLRIIYLLYGLPLLIFRTTVAHEYAHAWQGEHCPLLEDNMLREGFAEWVAYHHLKWLGCTKVARRMLYSQHPYRPALEHVLSLEQRLGIQGVIEYIKRAE